MAAPINAAAVAALAEEPLDWRFKGLPASWWGRTPAHICPETPELFEGGAVGPVCVLRAGALAHNVTTMAGWCRDRGVELAPHGKTHMRLVGIAGYEAAQGHDVAPEARANVTSYLSEMRAAAVRLAALFETDRIIATAGGSTYFDAVADVLTGWPAGMPVRTVLRSGCCLTHDHGLYQRTSPLAFRPALQVWAQVVSRPEPELAVLTMGRRDVSFDQDLPVPLGLSDGVVTKLNDQHAYLRLGAADGIEVGAWLGFGISHPCTVFDKWQLIPELDADDRVVGLIRTFF